MTPDRHLGAACISRCEPNLLITETTYATTIRDSKRVREREFIDKILATLMNGGKVLLYNTLGSVIIILGFDSSVCTWKSSRIVYLT